MSNKACKKEILCLRVASAKLFAIVEQLNFICELSENNYTSGIDVNLKEIELSTQAAERIIQQSDKLIKALS